MRRDARRGRVEGRGGARSAALLPPLLCPSRPVPSAPEPAHQSDPARPPLRQSLAVLAAAHGARKMEDYGRFLALLASALLVGFASVVISLVWVFQYRGGLSWDGSSREFNWHPILIVMGFVFIQGIGASEARVGPELRGSRVCPGPGRREGAGGSGRGRERVTAGAQQSLRGLGKPAFREKRQRDPCNKPKLLHMSFGLF